MRLQVFFFTYTEIPIKNNADDYIINVYENIEKTVHDFSGTTKVVQPVFVGTTRKSRGNHFGEETEALQIILRENKLRQATIKRMEKAGVQRKDSDPFPDYYLRRYYDGAAVERFGFKIIDLRNV